jgi:hypothetical protein
MSIAVSRALLSQASNNASPRSPELVGPTFDIESLPRAYEAAEINARQQYDEDYTFMLIEDDDGVRLVPKTSAADILLTRKPQYVSHNFDGNFIKTNH